MRTESPWILWKVSFLFVLLLCFDPPFRVTYKDVFENEIRKSRNYTLIIPKSFPKTMGFKKKLFETNPDQDNQSRCRTEVRNYLEEPDIANPPPKESYK